MVINEIRLINNLKILNSSTSQVHNSTEKASLTNINIDLFKEVKAIKLRILIEIVLKIGEGYSKDRILLLNQTMDFCGLLKIRTSSWHAKFLFGELDKYPGLPTKCPVAPAKFELNAVKMNLNFIPVKPVPELKFYCIFDFFTSHNKRHAPLTYSKIEGLVKDTERRNYTDSGLKKFLG